MSNGSPSSQLEQTVERSISDGRLEMFSRYWELYWRTAAVTEVDCFFVRTESRSTAGGYCNAAIIGDGLLVDVEGDDGDRSGSLTAHSLDAFERCSYMRALCVGSHPPREPGWWWWPS